MAPHSFAAAALALAALAACDWVELAANAATYPTVASGEAANVVALDSLLYVTRGEAGFTLETTAGRTIASFAPAPGSASADDLAIADGLLFVLDARSPGFVSAWSLADPLNPELVSGPLSVPVEPFSGISAAGGVCVVSGGTSQLTAWRYDGAGALSGPFASSDLGRGQPDILLAPGGRIGFVSTHYSGPRFGLDVVSLDSATGRVSRLSGIRLAGAGFTSGGAKPASFPIQVARQDDSTLLVAHARGVALLDVRQPRAPALRGLINVGGPATGIAVREGTAAVAVGGARPALVFLDLTGPRPIVARHVPLERGVTPLGIALTPRHAAVAARGRGILVFDR
jgi:hypothetical protein